LNARVSCTMLELNHCAAPYTFCIHTSCSLSWGF
jgi:hypothetical protein